MNRWQNGNGSPPPSGHIYVNGYGFVSEDPWLRENRSIWKYSAVIGLILIAILVIPLLASYPVQIFLTAVFAPFVYMATDTYASFSLQALYQQSVQLCCYLASVLLPLLFAAVVLRPHKRNAKPFFRQPAPRMIGCAVPISMAVWVIFYLAGMLLARTAQSFHILMLSPGNAFPAYPLPIILYLLRVLLFPAILEELLFRGIILRSLRRFGDSFAIVVSSAAFGLIHYTLTKDIRAFALGLVLAYFVIRSGSLWTAVMGRFACLLLDVLLECMPHFFPGSMSVVMQNLLFLAILAIGLLCFVQLCRMEGNPFVLSTGNTSTKISGKLLRFFGNAIFVIAAVLWAIQAVGYMQIIG